MRQDSADAQARENLAATFYRLGAAASNLQRNEQAAAYLEKSRAMLALLQNSEPKNMNYKMQTGRIHTRFGFVKANQNDWQNAAAEYRSAAAAFEAVTRIEPENNVAWRYLAGQYSYIAEIHAKLLPYSTAENRTFHKNAAQENYRRALDIYLQLQARKALVEVDRKFLEETQNALRKIQN